VSFDVSESVSGVDFADEDLLEFDPSGPSWSLWSDGSVDETISLESADLVAVPEPKRFWLLVPGIMLLGLLAWMRRARVAKVLRPDKRSPADMMGGR
jgi:hypothetical protein